MQEEDPISASAKGKAQSLFVIGEPILLRSGQEHKDMNAAAGPQATFLFTRGFFHLKMIHL